MHNLDGARLAGNIIRYHAWPTVQTQTNAHHTWNVMRIYAELFGWPKSEVAAYIQYHDVGELDTGDIAFNVKRNNPQIKEIITPVEEAAVRRLSLGIVTPNMIDDEEKIKVKICDLMEMLEFSLDEMRLGSRHYGWMIFENIYQAMVYMQVPDHLSGHLVWQIADNMMDKARELK